MNSDRLLKHRDQPLDILMMQYLRCQHRIVAVAAFLQLKGGQESVDKENKNASYPLNTPKLWQDSPSTPEMLYGSIVELTAESLEYLVDKDRYSTRCLLTRQPDQAIGKR
ncbi:hypothetical protein BGZ83_001788 [Gryganskiella cystojenkinii]|nr:hypothetical protein BGZ83_001788 [Gryganskiella cystojenkinii]